MCVVHPTVGAARTPFSSSRSALKVSVLTFWVAAPPPSLVQSRPDPAAIEEPGHTQSHLQHDNHTSMRWKHTVGVLGRAPVGLGEGVGLSSQHASAPVPALPTLPLKPTTPALTDVSWRRLPRYMDAGGRRFYHLPQLVTGLPPSPCPEGAVPKPQNLNNLCLLRHPLGEGGCRRSPLWERRVWQQRRLPLSQGDLVAAGWHQGGGVLCQEHVTVVTALPSPTPPRPLPWLYRGL